VTCLITQERCPPPLTPISLSSLKHFRDSVKASEKIQKKENAQSDSLTPLQVEEGRGAGLDGVDGGGGGGGVEGVGGAYVEKSCVPTGPILSLEKEMMEQVCRV